MTRLFAAAWPPADVVSELRTLDRPDEPGVRWVPEVNWHITVRFFGEADLDDVATRLEAASLPRATVHLGPRIGRLDVRQIVVPARGVDELAAAVRDATSGVGEIDRRRFRGHLTLARTRPRAPSLMIGAPFTASWEIGEVAVVESDLRPTGVVYTTVASFATS